MSRTRTGALALAGTLLAVLTPVSSAQATPSTVDESRLQPALSPAFAPWDCKLKTTGPVCTGERHLEGNFGIIEDFGCSVPLWNTFTSDRYQTRYYDQDYRNVDRSFRTKDTDFLSTSPTGQGAATIDTHVRFTEPFAAPGDDTTRTIISSGTILEVRPVTGPALLRIVGTLVEPWNASATFSGNITVDGVTTRYADVPYDSVFTFELFADAVCRAATGLGAAL
ncbi:MAG: hypothetical protein LH469_00635 [Frankiaceae bacterium]|nr:hypothetical protein [Frankiaceae bacterium]